MRSPLNTPVYAGGFQLGRSSPISSVILSVVSGIAGPAKLQTMIKFAMACGVGPSVRVLKKRALDVSKLLVPYEPNEVLAALAAWRAAHPASAIEQIHFFPLGGIKACVDCAQAKTAAATLATAV